MIALPIAPSPRRAVAATFAAFGLALGAWGGASATVVARVGVSAFQFGVALTLMTVLYLAAMGAAGTVAARLGTRRTMLAALLCLGPILAALVAARTPLWLDAALALFGALGGLLDSAMNAEGARVEHQAKTPIFARFHACASGGIAVGAAFGGWLAFNGYGGVAALCVEAALLVAALEVARAISEPPGEPRIEALSTPPALESSLAILGLAIGVSIVCETSAVSWAALLMRHAAPSLAAYAGLGAAFFAGVQACMRIGVDGLRRRVADRALMLASYAVAALGLALVGCDLGFAPSALGFAILGAGTGAIVPCGFSLAARRPGLTAGSAISSVAFFGLLPRGPAPLLTGFVADAFSLSTAFFGLAAFMLIAWAAVAIFVPAARAAQLASGGVAP